MQMSKIFFLFRLLFPKCGTPGYVAPEIANLENKKIKYDKVCDIFSVGVIFFKMLSLSIKIRITG